MQDIPPLDVTGLRKFGLTTAGITVILCGLLVPSIGNDPWPWWPWAVSLVLSLWALIAPASLNTVYRPWMKAGLILGSVNTQIILGVVFWILIWPLGILLRLFQEKNVSTMRQGFQPLAKTYWNVDCVRSSSMEKPF
jgi:hypothetical protein